MAYAMGYDLSPLAGLGECYSNRSPMAYAMGYDLSPLAGLKQSRQFSV
jgi:hypothetical protein